MAVYERFDFGVDGFVRLVDDQGGVLWEPTAEGAVGVGVPRLKCSRCGHFNSHSKKDCKAKVDSIYHTSAQKSRLKQMSFAWVCGYVIAVLAHQNLAFGFLTLSRLVAGPFTCTDNALALQWQCL